jgi:hypothetical protein
MLADVAGKREEAVAAAEEMMRDGEMRIDRKNEEQVRGEAQMSQSCSRIDGM